MLYWWVVNTDIKAGSTTVTYALEGEYTVHGCDDGLDLVFLRQRREERSCFRRHTQGEGTSRRRRRWSSCVGCLLACVRRDPSNHSTIDLRFNRSTIDTQTNHLAVDIRTNRLTIDLQTTNASYVRITNGRQSCERLSFFCVPFESDRGSSHFFNH
jgi:hypothetical protein